jgi:hypothetical protein
VARLRGGLEEPGGGEKVDAGGEAGLLALDVLVVRVRLRESPGLRGAPCLRGAPPSATFASP